MAYYIYFGSITSTTHSILLLCLKYAVMKKMCPPWTLAKGLHI